jgi:hypothetical protein
MSVPLPPKLKEAYEPPVQRFIANPAKVNPLLEKRTQTGEGVSVYRTPATQTDHELKHFFDGGLERLPNSDVFNSDNSKLLTFLQNPSSHFERLSSPLFYKLVSCSLLLSRRLILTVLCFAVDFIRKDFTKKAILTAVRP